MIQIKLETRDGGLVKECLIPSFNPPPEAIAFGARTFIRNDKKSMRMFDFGDSETLIYTEGLCFYVA